VVILAMLGTTPRRRRNSTDHHSTGGHTPRAHSSGTPRQPHAHGSLAGAMGEAYGRFLELPVLVVLVTLWLLGTIVVVGLVLGLVTLAAIALG